MRIDELRWIRIVDKVPTESDGLTFVIGKTEKGELMMNGGWAKAKNQSKKLQEGWLKDGYLYWISVPEPPE